MPTGVYPRPSLESRIKDHCVPEPNTGCWLWTAAVNNWGYGMFWHDGSMRAAHRVAYETFIGPIPTDLTIDHLCRTRTCVNPDHLEPVTRGENVLRGESTSAKHLRATHCPQGHPYSGDNLYVSPQGFRSCRACIRARVLARQKVQ